MIFINHIPQTILGAYTIRNFGFSDAAEAFVLISGISAGLAYSPFKTFKRSARLQPWKRAFTIWWVQVIIVLLITLILAVAQHLPGVHILAAQRNVQAVLDDPASFIAPLLLLGHQFNCVDILPLYVLFMLAAPVLIAIASRWPPALMAASSFLWLVVGLTGLNLPTWPLEGVWFFNPLSWQVLFVAGIVTGLAMSKGCRALPVRSWAVLLAALFVVFSALWMQVPALADLGYDVLWNVHDSLGVPQFLTSFDKTFLAPLRLWHILALAYLLSAWPLLHRIAIHRGALVFTSLGRNALPVFATATVLSYLIQIVRVVSLPSDLLDTLLTSFGLVLLALVALAKDRWTRRKRIATALPRIETIAAGLGQKPTAVFRRESK
jgi:hypothetical protein